MGLEASSALPGLAVSLAAVCVAVLLTASPGAAHSAGKLLFTWVTQNACAASEGYIHHDTGFEANTVSTKDECNAMAALYPNFIRNHAITYKNGDGYGGYEIRRDWGVLSNGYTTDYFRTSWSGNLANYFGPGYFTNDVGSSVYYSWCGHCGGWVYAAGAHWL